MGSARGDTRRRPGRQRDTLEKSADEIAGEICAAIAGDFGDASGKEGLLFINGFGGTPLMELYLMYNSAHAALAARGIKVTRSLVGNYVTSLDMAGCSVTLTLLVRS